jgi:NAD(P)-dependent dehydrogenase (short-subunit alcohol dehydrogenase family)
MLDMRGKTVAITGAGQGLGEAVADVATEAGASVALIDTNADAVRGLAERLGSKGAQAAAFACDISDEASVERTVSGVVERFGRCDGLVANAGVVSFYNLEDLPAEEWNRLISVNLTGTFFTLKHFGRQMLRQESGSIVTITSTAASIPQSISGAYSPSKAGAKMLGRLAAVEWGKRGIRSNVISPGAMFTPMTKRFQDDPEMLKQRSALIASGRVSDPHEVANVVVFLLSDLSSYINAAHIDVDGGLRQMMLSMVPRKGVNRE